jgi:predicted phosphoribosyltransferase
MPFTNRSDAGRQLAKALSRYRGKNVVVLALPRGGVPVAYEIATRFDAPLDLVLVRKIGVPMQPELAMGAVVDGAAPLTVRNEDVIAAAGVTEREFAAVRKQELDEIRRRRSRYLGNRPGCPIEGRIAIVVDDGIATGATMRAALRSVRSLAPATLVLAVPVASSDTLASLGAEADQIVCLEEVEFLSSIGAFYDDFDQTSDEEVTSILARTAPSKEH